MNFLLHLFIIKIQLFVDLDHHFQIFYSVVTLTLKFDNFFLFIQKKLLS